MSKAYFSTTFQKRNLEKMLKTNPKRIVSAYWQGYSRFNLDPNEGIEKALDIKLRADTKAKYDLLDQYVRGSNTWEGFLQNFKNIYDMIEFEGKLDFDDYVKNLPEVYNNLAEFEPPAMGKGNQALSPPVTSPPKPSLRGSKKSTAADPQPSKYQNIDPNTPKETVLFTPREPPPGEDPFAGIPNMTPKEEDPPNLRGANVEVEITSSGDYVPVPPPPQMEEPENPAASSIPSTSTADPIPPAPAPAPAPMESPLVESSDNISRKTSTVSNETFSKTDAIPKKRLITEGKSIQQLKDDLRYFKKNFRKELFRVQVDFNSNNLEYLQSKHKEIVAKLNTKKQSDKKIGIIINASDYIKEKLKEILVENSIKGLTAKDLIIDVEESDKPKDEDIGSYEFKVGADGMPKAKREPIYKYIPEVNPKQVLEPKNARIKNPPTKYRGLEQTAKKMVMGDPFIKPQKSIRFKYSY